jgi:DUF971 family protein
MTHDAPAFKPRNIAVAGRELALAWADGHESYLPFDDLRGSCPCSLCRAQREAPPDPLRIVPVGAYAVQIVWSDGHDTGIYAFEMLRKACACPACRPQGGVA